MQRCARLGFSAEFGADVRRAGKRSNLLEPSPSLPPSLPLLSHIDWRLLASLSAGSFVDSQVEDFLACSVFMLV